MMAPALILSAIPVVLALYLVSWRYRVNGSNGEFYHLSAHKGAQFLYWITAVVFTLFYLRMIGGVAEDQQVNAIATVVEIHFLGGLTLAAWCSALTRSYNIYYDDEVLYWNGFPFYWKWYSGCEIRGRLVFKNLSLRPRFKAALMVYPLLIVVWTWMYPRSRHHIDRMRGYIGRNCVD